jgi:DNA-binding transcriptional regulator YiaG
MKQNRETAHARKLRQSPQTRADLGLRFKAECGALGLSVAEVAKLLQVTSRTVHNWFSGRVRVPYSAVKVLRLMKHMDMPAPGWDGWTFHSGKLWSPEGRSFVATDGSWWSLLVRQARCFREAYAQACQLRADLAAVRAEQASGFAGAASVPDAGGPGLVTSINNAETPVISSHQIDHRLTSCPTLSGFPNSSTPGHASAPQPLALASMPSSVSPSMPTWAGASLPHLAMPSSSTSFQALRVKQSRNGRSGIQSQSLGKSQANGSAQPLPSGICGIRSVEGIAASRMSNEVAS